MAALALGLALALNAAAGVQAGPRRALVIGNDAYPGPNRLDSCVNDARAIRDWLLSEGYQPGEVTLLTNARKVEMAGALETLVRECRERPHDQVVIFYSGHGSTVHDEDGDEGPEDDTDEALVGVDEPRSLRSWKDLLLIDDELYRDVNEISKSTRQVVILLDSCYSGGSFKAIPTDRDGSRSKRISEGDLRRMLQEAGVFTGPLRSDDPAERAGRKGGLGVKAMPSEIRDPPPGHGILFVSSSNQYQESSSGRPLSKFTAAWLRALGPDRDRIAGADGSITLEGLERFLRESLYAIPQTPVVIVRGLPRGTRLLPDLFPDPGRAALQGQLAAIVEGLLALPATDRAATWTLDAAPSKPGPLQVGTRFALRVRPGHSGHLVALTVSASGDVAFLFPNRFRPNNRVEGGREVLIPYPQGLMIVPPAGQETYYVYQLDDEHNPFAEVSLGEAGETLVVGKLDDVARRLESGGRRVDVQELTTALARGIAIEPVAAGAKPAPVAPRYGRWTRAVVTVRSVE